METAKLTIWSSANEADPNIYANLNDFCEAANIEADIEELSRWFGIGRMDGVDGYKWIIQGDGISYFVRNHDNIFRLLPDWVRYYLADKELL